MEDFARRTAAPAPVLEALATAGAFASLGLERREALWAAGAAAQASEGRLEGVVTGTNPPALPGMSEQEEHLADLWATGVAPDGHPTRFVRDRLAADGAVTAAGLADLADGARVAVGGVVTHRQRPATAAGTTFLSMEDETGLINVVVSKGCWARHRRVARDAVALVVKGRLEKHDGAMNVVAERLLPLHVGSTPKSRDFR
jgi:error-prone DNA polymerase